MLDFTVFGWTSNYAAILVSQAALDRNPCLGALLRLIRMPLLLLLQMQLQLQLHLPLEFQWQWQLAQLAIFSGRDNAKAHTLTDASFV